MGRGRLLSGGWSRLKTKNGSVMEAELRKDG